MLSQAFSSRNFFYFYCFFIIFFSFFALFSYLMKLIYQVKCTLFATVAFTLRIYVSPNFSPNSRREKIHAENTNCYMLIFTSKQYISRIYLYSIPVNTFHYSLIVFFQLDNSWISQNHNDNWNQHYLNNNSRNSICNCSCKERTKGKASALYAHVNKH